MTALVGVSCDGCETTMSVTVAVQATVGRVRDAAKNLGWHKTRGKWESKTGRVYGYSRDICPTCWAKGVR